jgi:biotin operon repressor
MIDRIRQDIQERLDQLLAEADRLRKALTALGGDRGGSSPSSARSAQPSSTPRSRPGTGTSSRARTGAGTGTATGSRAGTGSQPRSRAAAGGTKQAVLKALADANGEAMTASQVAGSTGLGRASVSTTLSKLARAGDVKKANRGYQLAEGAVSGDSTRSEPAAAAGGTHVE